MKPARKDRIGPQVWRRVDRASAGRFFGLFGVIMDEVHMVVFQRVEDNMLFPVWEPVRDKVGGGR